jgi:hypothetical protein
MENRDRKTDDDPSHSLFFVEAADRRQGDQERAQDRFGSAGDGTPQTSQTPPQAQRSGVHRQGQRVPDHQAPLDYDMPDAPEWAR